MRLWLSRGVARTAQIKRTSLSSQSARFQGWTGGDRITAAMQAGEWPTETVVISRVDGLTKNQFVELVQKPNTTYDTVGNRLDQCWLINRVNCVVAWAKF